MEDHPAYYIIHVPSMWPVLYESVSVFIDTPHEVEVEAYMRYMGTPSSEQHDTDGVETAHGIRLTARAPQPGAWILMLAAEDDSSNVTVRVHATTCPVGSAGPNCTETLRPVRSGSSFLNLHTTNARFQYFQWMEPAAPLWVSVSSAVKLAGPHTVKVTTGPHAHRSEPLLDATEI